MSKRIYILVPMMLAYSDLLDAMTASGFSALADWHEPDGEHGFRVKEEAIAVRFQTGEAAVRARLLHIVPSVLR